MIRVVADLGNTRLKWGRLDAGGRISEVVALPLDEPDAWASTWGLWNPGGLASSWAIASVNPPLAGRLGAFLGERGIGDLTWYRSAAEVPIRHALERIETAGADRAMGVAAACLMHPPGRAGLVASCGTALAIERIDADGIWQGGAIVPGLGLSSRALHLLTAQLPLVRPSTAPPAWGPSTRPAMEAGLFWGTVGALRELLTRQTADLSPSPWLVWTGGDAEMLAPWVEWPEARVVPDLVLNGLARLAFDRGLGGDGG